MPPEQMDAKAPGWKAVTSSLIAHRIEALEINHHRAGRRAGRVRRSRTVSRMSLMLPDGIAETPQPRLQKRVGRSSRVHRQTAGRDYAAPLQWKLLSLSSASGWTARK